MKEEKVKEFFKIYDIMTQQIEQGILFPKFVQFIEENHISYGINLATKYGPVIIIKPSVFFGEISISEIPNILPGASIKNAIKGLTNDQVLNFLRENKYRIVIKSFKKQHSKGYCFRYYLRKLKNAV